MPSANNYFSGPDWRNVWVQPACPYVTNPEQWVTVFLCDVKFPVVQAEGGVPVFLPNENDRGQSEAV
jgi:hypothetical protein